MPLIFYVVSIKRFSMDNINHTISKLKLWSLENRDKHIGFILQSLFESFPQLVLQLSYLVWYQQSSIILFVSIISSFVSVIMKSFIFIIGIDVKTIVFNWLCLATDFLSM